MFHPPDNYPNVSMKLSEVLHDIGVNEDMVLKTRRAELLQETITTVSKRDSESCIHIFGGSRSEGTTTEGLKSDFDILTCLDDVIVIQDGSEYCNDKGNFLMIQNETTPPGYCLLQSLMPSTYEDGNHYVKDTNERILLKNTVISAFMPEGCHRQGPASTFIAQPGVVDNDMVTALPCKSWPHSLGHLFDKQQTNAWLTLETKTYAKTTQCFVVGVGSKVSENADFEWRISTSLAERCLMFNLNITQIRCYILMKMILKRYINLDNESYISSFMFKTVLFHCIASKPSNIWKECNLINCLCYCIYTLNQCVLCGNCPHFIVHGNNVMAGKFSAEVTHELLERMSNLIPCDEILLSQIQCDDLGLRLQIKLNEFSVGHHEFYNQEEYTNLITGKLLMCIPENISGSHNSQMHSTKDESFETLLQIVLNFTRYYRDGNILEKTACRLLAPKYCTSTGSLIASQNIQINNTVSPQALAWLDAGQDSDVASSRLKLASVMYCSGDMERAAFILNNIEQNYNTEVTAPVCGCYSSAKPYIKIGFCQLSCLYGEERVKDIVALCVRFYPWEINCVPHELRYEMFRSTQEDLEHRSINDLWMDCAVVDSLPYLYFLQYKTYGNMQRPVEQQQALTKLMWVNETEPNFRHRETALNLLGQCMEQENRPIDALQYYMLSLRHRERNNAAKIHICRCLANTIS